MTKENPKTKQQQQVTLLHTKVLPLIDFNRLIIINSPTRENSC